MTVVEETFELRSEPKAGQRSVEIVLAGGYCYDNRRESKSTVNHVDVVESEKRIVLSAYVNVWDGPCRGIGAILREDVELTQPVGGRAIFDGFRDPPTLRVPKGGNNLDPTEDLGPTDDLGQY